MSYCLNGTDLSIDKKEFLRTQAISLGRDRAMKAWNVKDKDLDDRHANYMTDFIPAATVAGLAGWLTMPFAAVAGVYSVFANNAPAAITPTCPTNQIWVFYGVNVLTLGDPATVLQFRRGAAGNLAAQFDLEELYGQETLEGYFNFPVVYENPDIATVNVTSRIILGAAVGCRVRLMTFIIERAQNTLM
jgi:hypothetical protein